MGDFCLIPEGVIYQYREYPVGSPFRDRLPTPRQVFSTATDYFLTSLVLLMLFLLGVIASAYIVESYPALANGILLRPQEVKATLQFQEVPIPRFITDPFNPFDYRPIELATPTPSPTKIPTIWKL